MKNSLVLVFLFLFTNSYAQFTTIPVSAPANNPPEFLHVPDGYIYLKKTYLKENLVNDNAKAFNLSIVKYDKAMKLILEQPVSDEGKGFSGYYASIKESGTDFWLVYLERFKNAYYSNCKNVMARKIDLTTLQTGDSKIVAEENSIDKTVNGYSPDNLKFLLETSPDKKHHALYINNEKGEFYISSLNEKFETVWKGKQIIPGADQFAINAFFPDNDGNIFVFSVNKKDNATVSHYSSTGIATHNKSVQESAVIFNARFFAEEVTGQILVAGTCKRDSKNITDVFKAVLNKKSLELQNIQFTRIPEEIIATLTSNGFGSDNSKKYGLHPSMFGTNICGNNESGMNLIIECKDKTGRDGTIDIVGNLINVNFNSAKTIFSNIQRYSVVYTADPNGNYRNFFCNKSQVLVYFDNPENLNRSLKEKPANFIWGKPAIIIAAFISADGSIIRKEISIDDTLGIWQSVNKYFTKECGDEGAVL